MIPESARLRFEPLTVARARAWLDAEGPVEGCVEGFPTDGDLRVSNLIASGLAAPATTDAPWSVYVMVERSSARRLGTIGFKYAPRDDAVEIGYAVGASRRGEGFAPEAIGALTAYAHDHGVRTVLAETDLDNLASQRALAKSGFVETVGATSLRWWRHDATP